MGQRFSALNERHKDFIKEQKIYFIGTAAVDGRVNVSPKGMDSLRVLDDNHVVWLNVTGSTNETAAHVQENDRMTVMFCSFEGSPLTLRLFGHAEVFHPRNPEWEELYALFKPNPGARQVFRMSIDMVQTSCGMSIPTYDYVADRELLNEWAEKKDRDEMVEYWKEKNQTSIDGKPSYILEESPK